MRVSRSETVGSKARRRAAKAKDRRKERGMKARKRKDGRRERAESRRAESWSEERKDGALSKEMEKERWGRRGEANRRVGVNEVWSGGFKARLCDIKLPE